MSISGRMEETSASPRIDSVGVGKVGQQFMNVGDVEHVSNTGLMAKRFNFSTKGRTPERHAEMDVGKRRLLIVTPADGLREDAMHGVPEGPTLEAVTEKPCGLHVEGTLDDASVQHGEGEGNAMGGANFCPVQGAALDMTAGDEVLQIALDVADERRGEGGRSECGAQQVGFKDRGEGGLVQGAPLQAGAKVAEDLAAENVCCGEAAEPAERIYFT